jgi:hypothetical protein
LADERTPDQRDGFAHLPDWHPEELVERVVETRVLSVYRDSSGEPWIEDRNGDLFPVLATRVMIIEALTDEEVSVDDG